MGQKPQKKGQVDSLKSNRLLQVQTPEASTPQPELGFLKEKNTRRRPQKTP